MEQKETPEGKHRSHGIHKVKGRTKICYGISSHEVSLYLLKTGHRNYRLKEEKL
jgi:hypothetical protein